LYEIEVGIAQSDQPSKRRMQLDTLLTVVAILPFDSTAAKRAADVSGVLGKIGAAIGPIDNLIAGTALANGATLVTHNAREFRRVRGLDLADWY
jgi:tRNA(fMet)-specific endonuclease VapC